jgi:hypothetical protein
MKCLFLNHDMRYVKPVVICGGILDGSKSKDLYKCTKCGKEELRDADH